MDLRINEFKRALSSGQKMVGIWSTLGSNQVVEILGHCGFDWVLLDTEHSPTEPPDLLVQLQALSASPTTPIVRPAWNDFVLTKRVLDIGAQTILFPYVQTAADAVRAVQSTRYPPHGNRGVSGSSRAAGYGMIPSYLARAAAEICVLVQIETAEGLGNLEAIGAVEGIDGVFIGPADLAASLGHLGNPGHPEVQAAIADALARLTAIGKPAGFLTVDEADAQRRLDAGFAFVAVGSDVNIMARNAAALRSRIKK
jgi:4-hydroxy-2-oxoheptanedioate aldolase